ncbi:MAG: nucleotidyltransferase family protein [Rickettsiales bacterium]|nr:nucleotidyltransferase family protein [Rickettsiales bacterium]
MTIRHAMVLAAGRGQRMRPLTDTLPKPLIQVAGRSMIDRQIDLLQAYGIERVVVNSSYLGEILQAHLRQRSAPEIIFSPEPTMLETGGGIVRALPLLGDSPFFAMNSDVILRDGPAKPLLQRMEEAWDPAVMDVLLLLQPREKAIGFEGQGDFFLERDGYTPRRRGEAPSAPYVFTGTQILHPRLFENAPADAFSMNLLYDRHRSAHGVLGRVAALVHDGHWLHVGDPQALAQAEAYFAETVLS